MFSGLTWGCSFLYVTFLALPRHCGSAFFVLQFNRQRAVTILNYISFFTAFGIDFDLAVTLSEAFNG